MPELSVLYVGACDLANTDKYTVDNVKATFPKDLTKFLEEWPEKPKVRSSLDLKNVGLIGSSRTISGWS